MSFSLSEGLCGSLQEAAAAILARIAARPGEAAMFNAIHLRLEPDAAVVRDSSGGFEGLWGRYTSALRAVQVNGSLPMYIAGGMAALAQHTSEQRDVLTRVLGDMRNLAVRSTMPLGATCVALGAMRGWCRAPQLAMPMRQWFRTRMVPTWDLL